MAIGTPTSLGTNKGDTVTSLAITTTAAVAAGDLIVILIGNGQAGRPTSTVTDTAGNAYTVTNVSQADHVALSYAYAQNAIAMASGATITVNFSLSSGYAVSAFTVSGVAPNNPLDITTVRKTGTTAISATANPTGVRGQPAEILFAWLYTDAQDPGVVTQGGSFTALGATTVTRFIKPAYQIANGANSISYAPSWITASDYSTAVITFKSASKVQGGSNLGNPHNQATSTTNVIVTANNICPAGGTAVLGAAYITVASTLLSVADSRGNTWQTPIDNTAGTGIGLGIAYAYNIANALQIGDTITATFSGTTTSTAGAIAIVGLATNVSPLDVHNKTATGLAATTATTVSTGTLSQADEIVVGFTATATSGAGYDPGGTFSTVLPVVALTPSINITDQVVSVTTSVDYTPSWTSASNYVSAVVSFQAPAGGTGGGGTGLLGVFP